MSYTTTDFLATVKQRAMIPTNQDTWQNPDILDLATEELRTHIMGLLISIREEYFVWQTDTTLVSGTKEYQLPRRALGQTVRDVLYSSDSSGDDFYSVPYLHPDQRQLAGNNYTSHLMVRFRWNKFIVEPDNNGGRLRIEHYIRPGELVETSSAGKVTAIDSDNDTVTLDNVPSSWASGTTVDWIKGTGGHEYLALSQDISSVSGSDVVFSSLPDDLEVGDWVALEDQSPVPQLPDVLQPVLAQQTAVQILESMGDPKFQSAEQRLGRLLKSALDILSPRMKGEAKKIVSNFQNRRWWSF